MPVRPNDDGNSQANSDIDDLPMDDDDKLKGLLGDFCHTAGIQLERSLSLEWPIYLPGGCVHRKSGKLHSCADLT